VFTIFVQFLTPSKKLADPSPISNVAFCLLLARLWQARFHVVSLLVYYARSHARHLPTPYSRILAQSIVGTMIIIVYGSILSPPSLDPRIK
jgi:hypothetical protein